MTDAATEVQYILNSLLFDNDYTIRKKGFELISRNAATLAQYIDLVAGKFNDSDRAVRKVAVETLGYLEPDAERLVEEAEK